MSEHRDPEFGKVISDPHTWGRDAIHVAVIPAKAGERLMAGEHVGLLKGVAVPTLTTSTTDFVGIVDPFLTTPVRAEEWVWLFLYPRSITGLRHAWTHPAFPEKEGSGEHPSIAAAKAWITQYAGQWGYTYEEIMTAARRGTGLSTGDQEESVDDRFYDYYRLITGHDADSGFYFHCAC